MSWEYPRTITLREVGVREGFQFEPVEVPTETKVELLHSLADSGLSEIEAASFVSPTRVPGWSDAEAVVSAIRKRTGVRFLAFYLNETGLRRALRTEAADIRGTLYVTASAEFLRRNTGWSPSVELDRARKMTSAFRQAGVAVSELTVMAAFGCNYSADVDVSTVINCIDRLQNASVESEHASDKTICLADTMAWATPKSIRHVVSSVRERWPESRIALHLHDTRGLAMANALAALELGVDCFDSAVAGLGGCPFASHQGAAGNICTEDFALLCEEMGIETGIDLDRLCEVAQFAESIVGHTLPGRVKQGMSLGSYRGGQ